MGIGTGRPRPLQSKIHSPSALRKILSRGGRRGKTLVFTNGCFDLIHRGHVTYLEKARALGDRLVVAVNSDASVRKLKGPSRPINPLRDRLEVLAAFECVDYVTWFGEDTPLRLIRWFRPEVLVKGGDWKPEHIAGFREVRGWGGRLRIISYVKGRSTTNVLRRARERA